MTWLRLKIRILDMRRVLLLRTPERGEGEPILKVAHVARPRSVEVHAWRSRSNSLVPTSRRTLFDRAFNGKFRAGCLNAYWFMRRTALSSKGRLGLA